MEREWPKRSARFECRADGKLLRDESVPGGRWVRMVCRMLGDMAVVRDLADGRAKVVSAFSLRDALSPRHAGAMP